ncbi:hypothetical protein ACP70R_035945 [Stipagrostis hirtigluma subsp. patula]
MSPTHRTAGAAAFGVPRGAPKEYCFRYCSLQESAPFVLGTAVAIHLGNTKSCVAGYDHYPGTNYYQFCILSWIAFTDNGTISGEAARNHAAVSPGTAVSGFKRLLGARLHDEVAKRAMELAPPYKLTQHLGWLFVQVDGRAEKFSVRHLAGILISELKHMAWRRRISAARSRMQRSPFLLSSPGETGETSCSRGGSSLASAPSRSSTSRSPPPRRTATTGSTATAKPSSSSTSAAARPAPPPSSSSTAQPFSSPRATILSSAVTTSPGGSSTTSPSSSRSSTTWTLSGADQEETLVEVESLLAGGANFSAPLTRAEFEELNRDLFERAMALVDEAVMRRGKPRVIDEVVVVGGSTRIPKVRELLKDYFHGREPNYSEGVEPDEAAVHGAALISRPEAARYLEECFEHWHAGDPRFSI